jgi:hypothetical protein
VRMMISCKRRAVSTWTWAFLSLDPDSRGLPLSRKWTQVIG